MESKTQFDVVGLGVSNLDILSRVDHFPAQEEVQWATQGAVQGGGPVATAIVTLVRLGARVAMLDILGDDWCGSLLRDEFQREGVCIDYLKLAPGATSSISSVLVRQGDGARSIVFARGTAPELPAADVPRQVIASARILHVNARHWEACLQACRYARESQVQVSFDGGAHMFDNQAKELIPLTDICIVARDFGQRYTGETDVRKAAETLLSEGPGLVVITDGAQGSWICPQDGAWFHQPAYKLPGMVDTTGCGDSYHGAFLFGLLQGLDLEATATFASAVAALNTQHLGGRGGLPNFEQVSAFLANLGESA